MNHPLRARTAALALGDALILLAVRPRWRSVATGLAHPRSWLAGGTDTAVAALSGALLWLVAAWLAVGLIAGLGVRLPGAMGRACTRVARVALPRVLVRVVLGSTTLGLLAAPAAQAGAATLSVPSASTPAAVALTTVGSAVPSPTWPVSPSASTPVAPPTWPTSSPAHLPAPAPPTSTPRTPAPPRTPPPPTMPTTGTRVHRGDSLWLLAARRLGPHADAGDVARYWPQIYAANRAVIGDHPAVIHPGQVLNLPAPSLESS